MQKLDLYGVQQRELSLFTCYLTNRKQFCLVSGINSETGIIAVDVPEGSCLDSLLFMIDINDLPLAVRNSTVSKYADDTSLCYLSNNSIQLSEAFNNDFNFLHRLQNLMPCLYAGHL